MKKFITLLSGLLFFLIGMAQTADVALFTENGERFTAYLNGKQVNTAPAAQVVGTDLRLEFAHLRVVFEDPSLGEFMTNVRVVMGSEAQYIIRRNNKGKWVANWRGEAPRGTTAFVDEPVRTVETTGSGGGTVIISSPNETVVQETTTITTTTSGNPNQVNTNVNMGGTNTGFGINVGVHDATTGEQISTNVNIGFNVGANVQTNQQSTMTTTTTTTTTTGNWDNSSSYSTTSTPSNNCTVAMSNSSFEAAVNSIQSKGFDETRVTTAKQVISSNCLTTKQVRQLLDLFSFEQSRLDVAKYAYTRVMDPSNYFMVNDAFSFESSISDLDAYIQQNRR